MTKRAFHSFEEFTQAWRQESLPEPRPLDNISKEWVPFAPSGLMWNRLSERHRGNRRLSPSRLSGTRSPSSLKRLTVSLLSLCLFAALGTSLYASVWETVKLKNKKGDVTFQYGQLSQEQTEKDRQVLNLENKYKDILHDAKVFTVPGQMNVLVIPELYELDGRYSIFQQDHLFTTPLTLQEATATSFRLPSYLPEGLSFEQGQIVYENSPVDHKALYQEAKAAGLPYVLRKVPIKQEAQGIYVDYGALDGPDHEMDTKMNLHIRPVEDLSHAGIWGSDASHKEYDVITIKGHEALFVKKELTLYLPVQTANGGLVYEIRSKSLNVDLTHPAAALKRTWMIPKEELVKVAESLLEE